MKSNVNLYQPKYQPTLRLLNLSIVVRLWGLSFLASVLVYAYFNFEQQQIESELSLVKENQKSQTMLVSELQLAVDNMQVDPQLLKTIEKNREILSSKQRVLAELSGQESLKSNGYANLMLELAQNHPKGLWLTHIQLDGQKVVMEGAANDSAIIPKWLNSLGKTNYFKGQKFADTRLYRDENQQLSFVITSGKSSTESKELKGE
ncbi:PilN domain-containing protein [Paraglaciecola aestuariivivens]